MSKIVYLVNFPSGDAVKGQEFIGSSDVRKVLEKRGVIGDGKISVENEDTSKLEAKVSELEEANGGLEAKVSELVGFVQAAIELPKGQVPNGFEG